MRTLKALLIVALTMMPAFAHGQTTASKCMWLGQTIAGLTAVEVRKYLESHQITDVMTCRYPGSFTLLHIAAGNSEGPPADAGGIIWWNVIPGTA